MKLHQKIGLLLLSTSLLAACTKNNTDLLSTGDGLAGSWLLQQQGTDLNDNGRFDTEEKNNVSDSSKISYQFKKDGSGFKIGANNTSVDSLSWELIDGSSTLYIERQSQGFIDKRYFKFQLGTNTLLLIDTSTTPNYMSYFERKN